jgi:type IV pilus assembly protein PilY1
MNALRHRLLALLLGVFVALPAARADDIDIYNNLADNPLKPPMTILVLDLNLLGICNSTLTPAVNARNPAAPQVCLDVRNNMLLSDLLGGVTNNPATYLTALLTGTVPGGPPGLSASQLCVINQALGLASPSIGLGSLPLLGSLGNLTCSTLGTLLGNPLTAPVVNGVLGGFVGQLVSGLVNPLLSTLVGQLPATIVGLLNTTISGVMNLGQVGLISLLESILNQLINSRVAIVVSHADRATAAGAPASTCAFGDSASIPTSRRETVGCSNGAYFLVGFTPLVDQGSVTQLLTRVTTLLTNALNPTNVLNSTTALLSTALTTPTSLLPPFQGKEVYAEIAHYLAGDAVFNAPLARWDGLTGILTRDTSIEAGSRYIQPPSQCDTVNVLNVQVTDSTRENESDATLRRYFPGAEVGGALPFANVVKQAQEPGFVDVNGNKISLRSHFLIQDNLSSLAALTNVGVNVNTYVNNLGLLNLGQSVAEFLKPTLSVDASLLTPSLTADPRKPGQVRSDAFFAAFRPDPNGKPRWPGNLKKLQVRDPNPNDTVVEFEYFDATSDLALADDGRIEKDALTFWTQTSLITPDPGDGRDATLGGAGQKIPGYLRTGGGTPGRVNGTGARKLFYDRLSASNVPSLAALDADDTTVRDELRASLGAANDTQTHELLLYARGYEVGTTATSLGVGSGLVGRSWLHGAVLHSRPVAVNYGARSGYSESNPDVRVIYGATDGFLRMVANTTSGGAQSGVESWAFLPRVVMSQQKILRDNQPASRFPYGVDGAPTVVVRDRDATGGPADGKIESGNSHDKAAVYFGLRRGGSHLYALDIKNPDSPTLMWRIGPDGLFNSSGLVAGSAAQFAEMALTFSSPQAGRIQYKEGSSTLTRSVIVFAAGYNGGRDAANVRVGKDAARGSKNLLGSDDAKGNAIYMVDAETGALIWKARQGALSALAVHAGGPRTFQHPLLADSIAADTTVVDSNGDGYLDRLYAVDTGGRLWRGDFAGIERGNWTLTALASVGRHHNASVVDDRRFFHAPDYVPFRDARGAYDAVVFASGDREDPFNARTENFLYTYRDRAVTSGKTAAQLLTTESALVDHDDFDDLTSACASGTQDCGASADDAIGWKLELGARGEKALSQPLTTGGTVFFTSYIPQDPTLRNCEPNEGTNRLYGVSLADSRPLVQDFIADNDGDKRSTDGGVPGLSGEINTLASNTIAANTQTLEARSPRYYPVYWRERRGDDETPP